MLDFLFLGVSALHVDILLSFDLLFDCPLAVLEEALEAVAHVGNSVLHGHPNYPRFASKPLQESEHAPKLSLCEACDFEHHCVTVPVEGQVEKEGHCVFLSVFEPLVEPLGKRQACVYVFVSIVIPIRLSRLFVLCPPVVLGLLLISVEFNSSGLSGLFDRLCCLFWFLLLRLLSLRRCL